MGIIYTLLYKIYMVNSHETCFGSLFSWWVYIQYSRGGSMRNLSKPCNTLESFTQPSHIPSPSSSASSSSSSSSSSYWDKQTHVNGSSRHHICLLQQLSSGGTCRRETNTEKFRNLSNSFKSWLPATDIIGEFVYFWWTNFNRLSYRYAT